MTQAQAIKLVNEELLLARSKFNPFASYHEGYAVILEEMDELWEEVKKKDRSEQRMANEARQVAAMAIRFLVDLAPGDVT